MNWKSYNTGTYEQEDDTFSGSEHTIYMHGTNWTASTQYKVAFYDAVGTRTTDARKIETDTPYADASGNLTADCVLTSWQATADAGTWQAVVFSMSDNPPNSYDPGSQYALADHEFTVEESAIPEFPTVFAAIGVAGLCFGIYWWMRKRRAIYVKA